ncbi:N-acetylmannosamine-6-phosphate 2-epimerase [Bacillus sp. REN3]|uniref:N-acetylmannosamine-6-phosphate 2-epimerase n=1 Tax=Bacillus sp. REN3 TaxID=2802440 RepID=UPI001AEDAF6E|nr:N-acetylmannosamine-6-phosphate 2-epimerase [Bacillus sp. REN3]
MAQILDQLQGKLIVSCQALENEPLYGAEIMAKMAVAAVEGGAAGIRANTPQDIQAIKKSVRVPVIGLYKRDYENSDIYITPTIREVEAIAEAGADIIAVDLTERERPDGRTANQLLAEIKRKFPKIPIMADISTAKEAVNVSIGGADLISTTLVGYTSYTSHIHSFQPSILSEIIEKVDSPIVAEGRIETPQQAALCLELGAFSVVVGSAITRPQVIARRFSIEMSKGRGAKEE